MRVADRKVLWSLGGLALCSLVVCCGPDPTRSLLDFDTPYGIVYGVSTEDGILLLSDALDAGTEELPFRYYVSTGRFDDVARLELKTDTLAILHAVSSRPDEARLAAEPAHAGEELYVESRDDEGQPRLEEVSLHQGGAGGNLIDVEGDAGQFARHHAGAPLLAEREGFYQIVGILNGIYSPDSPVVGFIGIEELTLLVLRPSDFVRRKAFPRRADFEYGVPRDFAGERVYATGMEPAPAPAPAEAPAPPPAEEPVAPVDQ